MVDAVPTDRDRDDAAQFTKACRVAGTSTHSHTVELGLVEIRHREVMTAAARWIMAEKL